MASLTASACSSPPSLTSSSYSLSNSPANTVEDARLSPHVVAVDDDQRLRSGAKLDRMLSVVGAKVLDLHAVNLHYGSPTGDAPGPRLQALDGFVAWLPPANPRTETV